MSKPSFRKRQVWQTAVDPRPVDLHPVQLNPIRMPSKGRMTFRTDTMETIDRMMDIQHTVFELSQIVNEFYRLQLLIMIITAFMVIVFKCYGLLDLITNTKKDFRVGKLEGSFLLAYQIAINIMNLLGMVTICNLLRASVEKTGDLSHKLMIVSRSKPIRERMMQFSMQIKRNIPIFTAFDMFEIDGTLIYGVVGATTTYLIILLQFSSSNPEVSEIK